MKKFFTLFLSFVMMCAFLCGCSFKQNFSSSVHEYLISALGFEEKNGKLTVYLEAIIVNQEDTNAEKDLQIIEGTGNTVYEAVNDANKKTSQPLMLSHCAVAVMGSSISPERFAEICNYCYSEPEITLSVMLVSTDNALNLLSCDAISSIAVGFDIMSMLEQQSSRTGIIYKNRFYEIESTKAKPLNTFAVPFLETTENGYFIDGVTVFNNYSQISRLSDIQSFPYAVATDTQAEGEVFIDSEQIKINSCNTVYKFDFKDNLQIKLTIDIKTSKDERILKENLRQKLLSEFAASKTNGGDIFGFGNLLQHFEKDIWKKVQNNYMTYYKNSVLTVEFI